MNPRKLARLIHPEFRFGHTTLEDGLKLVEMGVGGFCFYGGTVSEVHATVRALKAASATPLIISADYENGVGHWLKDAVELPTNMAIGASGSADLARRKGEITAAEARALGVDWVFAPVVDLATNPANPIVNLRAYGEAPGLVSELAAAYMSGLRAGGALACIKHFPGHGETSVDSHLVLPVLERTLEDLESSELKPYRALIGRADSVMIGHLMIPALDQDNAASFSHKIITGLLRNSLKYDGCIITDALSMKAISDESSSGVKALLAGADILLVPEDAYKLHKALINAAQSGRITEALVDKALARQDALAKKLIPALEPRDLSVINCESHRRFVREAAPDCMAWAFRNRPFDLKAGETIGYFEPVTPRAEWKGGAFISELEQLGVKVVPYEKGKTDKFIIGSFSRPRAYSGSINLNAESAKEIKAALSGGHAAMIAFGSPFVFGEFHKDLAAGLCAFTGLVDFQRTAARIMTGASEARGRMPVTLDFK